MIGRGLVIIGGSVRSRASSLVRSASTSLAGPYGTTCERLTPSSTGRRPACRMALITCRTPAGRRSIHAVGSPHIPRTTWENQAAVWPSMMTTDEPGGIAAHMRSTAAISPA